MSRIFEALRRAEEKRRSAEPSPHTSSEAGGARVWSALWEPLESAPRHGAPEPDPIADGSGRARVVTLASLKGGVGKTVIAANLAFYLHDLEPEVPTLLLACDDDPLADRMFAWNEGEPRFARTSALPSIGGGRYGVSTLRPIRRSWGLASAPEPDSEIAHLLAVSDWDGVVVVDTPPDFGARTRGALAASDLILVPVSDRGSLDKVAELFNLMDEWGLPRERVQLFLSQLDLRIKYREGESRDVLALLVSEIRRRRWPLLGAFLSRTPKVASLYTNASRRPLPVALAAPGSVVHRQFRHLADDVRGLLAPACARHPVSASAPAREAGVPAPEPAAAELRLA